MKVRVYDERTNETLFESDNRIDCSIWMNTYYPEDSKDFPYVWMEDVKE